MDGFIITSFPAFVNSIHAPIFRPMHRKQFSEQTVGMQKGSAKADPFSFYGKRP